MEELLFGIFVGTVSTLIAIIISKYNKTEIVFTETGLEEFINNISNTTASFVIEDLLKNPEKYEILRKEYLERINDKG